MTEAQYSDETFTSDGHLTEAALTAAASGSSDDWDGLDQRAAQNHVEQCSLCAAHLGRTKRVITALAAPSPMEAAPEGLWDRVAQELQISSAASSSTALSPHNTGDGIDADKDSNPTDGRFSTVQQLHPQLRPRRSAGARWLTVFAAAAAGVVVGAAAVTWWLQSGQDDQPPSADAPTVVGGAVLEPVASDDLTGQAQMVDRGDGELELRVDLSATADPADGYFEVWLRDEDASRLMSLGAATAESTTLQVPAGIDLSQYPIVDVSHEHFDGDPTHSGTTLAAGPMEGVDE